MQEVLSRLKSPVVIIQLISIVVGVLVFFWPGVQEQIQIVAGAVVAIINVLAGLNNPADPQNF